MGNKSEILVNIQNMGALQQMSTRLGMSMTDVVNDALQMKYDKMIVDEMFSEEMAGLPIPSKNASEDLPEEFNSKIRVYASIHTKVSPEAYKELIEVLQKTEVPFSIKRFERERGWDSYDIKNSELLIVIPECKTDHHILGMGTLNEMGIAERHDRLVIVYDHETKEFSSLGEITKFEKTERTALRYARMETGDWKDIKQILEVIKTDIILKGHKNYQKNVDIV